MDQSSSERCKIQKFIMNPSSTHIFPLNECNWISFYRHYFLVKKMVPTTKRKKSEPTNSEKVEVGFLINESYNFFEERKNSSRAKIRSRAKFLISFHCLFICQKSFFLSLVELITPKYRFVWFWTEKKTMVARFFHEKQIFFTRATLRRQKSVFASERWNSAKVLRGRKYFSPEYL